MYGNILLLYEQVFDVNKRVSGFLINSSRKYIFYKTSAPALLQIYFPPKQRYLQ